MNVVSIELRVSPGFANEFDLGYIHYGLLLHWRERDGAQTRDIVEFRPFRSEGGDELTCPGVEVHRERLEFERGFDTDLDRVVVGG